MSLYNYFYDCLKVIKEFKRVKKNHHNRLIVVGLEAKIVTFV